MVFTWSKYHKLTNITINACSMWAKVACYYRYTYYQIVVLQVKKCGETDCIYCSLQPPRLPADIFDGLHFLPDPVVLDGGYEDFDQLYGTVTSEKDRPSLISKPQSKANNTRLYLLVVSS